MVSCVGTSSAALDKGDDMVDLVSQMVKSDECVKVMIGNANAYDKVLSEIKAEGFFDVSAVYEVSFSWDELISPNRVVIDDIPKDVVQRLTQGSGASLVSHINSRADSERMVVSSVFGVSGCFVDKSIKEPKYLLYAFDSGYSMLISFYPDDDGAVLVAGNLILNDDFKVDNADSIEASFKSFGIDDVTVKKIR
jgi:hypothetical protein